MEWDLKLPPWDLTVLELDAGLSIGPMVGSNSGSRQHVRGHDCSVDLKLGGTGDLGPHKKWKVQSRVTPAMVPSSSGTSKRARAASNGSQTASCSVDGCLSDLSKCREYHRRHKVCEDHSKTAIVLVGGREQRFCQQCSRFHSLAEFDETKRSCRKRLDGHNRRRRKSQPDYLGTVSLIANHQGGGFSGYPQIFPTATPQHNWARIIKSEDNALYTQRPPLHFIDRQQNCLGSSQSCKVGKQFPFLHDSTASSESSSGFAIYTDGIAQVLSSDCALSLLSSPPRSLGFDLSQIVPSARVPIGQPLVPEMQFGRHSRPRASTTASPTQFWCSTVENGHMIPSFVPDASDTHLHCFHVGVEGSSDGTAQTLPFYWQ